MRYGRESWRAGYKKGVYLQLQKLGKGRRVFLAGIEPCGRVLMEIFLCVCLGIGLSAACGFRVFVPFLILSIAALSGHVQLAKGFAWIGTYPALITFSVATVLEILGYYIPWVDHLLDTMATPAAVVACLATVA